MKSPFPGMDPYLERYWPNVHVTMLVTMQRLLQPKMPPGLRARAEQAVLFEEGAEDGDEREYRADVAVVDSGARSLRSGPDGGLGLMPSVVVELSREPVRDRWLQIVDVENGHRVVTVIELLSSTNKAAGEGSRKYRQKLAGYARGGVNVVEVDLLRWPTRSRLEVGQEHLPADRRTPYLACVRRAAVPSRWEMFPLPLRARLGAIPVPLREGQREVELNLQEVIDAVYAEAGYGADLDYDRPLEPPLEAGDAAWAAEVVRAGRGAAGAG